VKDIYVVGKKMAKNGRKTDNCQSQTLVISLYLMLKLNPIFSPKNDLPAELQTKTGENYDLNFVTL
jgi:hypothetical protein